MRMTLIEPTIAEMLNDPIVGLLMERDGVTAEGLRRLLYDTRRQLKEGQGRSKPTALPASLLIEAMTRG
jgi:hypothetical protein